MNLDGDLQSALQAYGEKFDNLDELAHPALLEEPRFPQFLLARVQSGVPATRHDLEAKFGELPWEW
jgi:hypothetical protein